MLNWTIIVHNIPTESKRVHHCAPLAKREKDYLDLTGYVFHHF